MSLMKTLAKVAIGVAVAKGASSLIKGAGQRQASASDDGLFRGAHSPDAQQASAGNPLEGMMDSILGGGAKQSGGGAQGGLGSILEQLSGGNTGGGQRGGLEDMLGGLGGGGSGGLGGLLGGLAGALQGGASSPQGSFGEVLNSQFDGNPEPARQPTADQEAAAALMLSAMLQAAKSDGKFDAGEQSKLMEKLGDVGPEERAFVNAELQKPVDVHDLCHKVPQGMEKQVYMMSILGIDLDSQAEAKYLHELASEMRISQDEVNAIHDRMGAPRIYR